jgi:hypothetical protein
MRLALVCLSAVTAAAVTAEAAPRKKPPMKSCVISVANPGDKLAIDGVELADFAPASIEKVLGKPDRIEKRTTQQHHELFGHDGGESMSETVEVTDLYYVYDTRGLVFPTRRTEKFDKRPEADHMIVFFARRRVFDHTKSPAVFPKQRGRCRLEVNGVAVDPTKDLRPSGMDYRTETAEMWKTKIAPTASSTVIDSLYTDEGSRSVRIYLDAPKTGRPSYAEIR